MEQFRPDCTKYIIEINKKKCYIGRVYLKNKKLNQNKDRHTEKYKIQRMLYILYRILGFIAQPMMSDAVPTEQNT
jgi:hypothetical protein